MPLKKIPPRYRFGLGGPAKHSPPLRDRQLSCLRHKAQLITYDQLCQEMGMSAWTSWIVYRDTIQSLVKGGYLVRKRQKHSTNYGHNLLLLTDLGQASIDAGKIITTGVAGPHVERQPYTARR